MTKFHLIQEWTTEEKLSSIKYSVKLGEKSNLHKVLKNFRNLFDFFNRAQKETVSMNGSRKTKEERKGQKDDRMG